jgi:hypothetical protein
MPYSSTVHLQGQLLHQVHGAMTTYALLALNYHLILQASTSTLTLLQLYLSVSLLVAPVQVAGLVVRPPCCS